MNQNVCRKDNNNQGDILETEDEKNKTFMTKMDIVDWNIELRTNNMCMDEQNADERKKKIEGFEKDEVQIDMKETKQVKIEREQIWRKKEQIQTGKEKIQRMKEHTEVLKQRMQIESG